MTCIAWDGKTIAADKRAVCGNMVVTTTKLRSLAGSGEVLAWSGAQDSGELVADWYTGGADIAKWPECQRDEKTWCRLIVASPHGVKVYERQPFGVAVEDPFMAWGCGADLARAAMHCGKTAREAVEIACLYDNGCGNGIDVLELEVIPSSQLSLSARRQAAPRPTIFGDTRQR